MLFCETILPELAQKLLHFICVTAEEVWERSEYLHDFLLVNLMIEIKIVEYSLHLLFKLDREEFRALKYELTGLLLTHAMALQYREYTFDVFRSLTQNKGVLDY